MFTECNFPLDSNKHICTIFKVEPLSHAKGKRRDLLTNSPVVIEIYDHGDACGSQNFMTLFVVKFVKWKFFKSRSIIES